MALYDYLFDQFETSIAQVLLTKNDLSQVHLTVTISIQAIH